MKRRRVLVMMAIPLLALSAVLVLLQPAASAPGTTDRVSVAWDGAQADGASPGVRVSADGRFVVFTSWASNLVPNDTNGTFDVFVRDRQAGSTERVSVASDGSQGNDRSLWEYGASISADGRFVTFGSLATNLVPGCGAWHIFLRDRQMGTTSCVNVAPGGAVANNVSWGPIMSADGRFVVFTSWASNLVPNDTNGTFDVFVRDLQTGATSRANVASDGSQASGGAVASSISANGRFVAFFSDATNLVEGDTNGAVDAFVHNFQTGETDRVSVAFDGSQADQGGSQPSVSDDGCFVAFESGSSLVPGCGTGQVFIRDRQAGTTICATVAPDGSGANNYTFGPSISANGRFVAFYSPASNVVAAGLDTNGTDDVFVHDRDTDGNGMFDEAGGVLTTRASVDSTGVEANGRSSGASISSDGRFVTFVSDASNLVDGDTNGVSDAFVHECSPDGSCGGPPAPTPTPPPDADGDGVPDAEDECPGTAPGVTVDGNGCSRAQVDQDLDGVCDPGKASSLCSGADACPDTAEDPDGFQDGDGCPEQGEDALFCESRRPQGCIIALDHGTTQELITIIDSTGGFQFPAVRSLCLGALIGSPLASGACSVLASEVRIFSGLFSRELKDQDHGNGVFIILGWPPGIVAQFDIP
jgi:Tol biopolymer transport system component